MKKFKKFTALVMTLCMVFAMSATAFASNYNVNIYKSNGTTTSMADAIVAGDAVVTQLESGYQIDIPIVPIYDYTMGIFHADGYLTELTVSNADSAQVIATSENTGDREYTPYGTATLRIITSTLPSDGRFNVTSSNIDLYSVGTSNTYWLSHVTPAFVIEIESIITE